MINNNDNEIILLLFRTAGSVFKDMIFIFGGHNGTILLNDFYYFNVCKLRLSINDYTLSNLNVDKN